MNEETLKKISLCKKEIRDEYLQPHSFPWIIGFSGGKDSTIVTQLVIEVLLDLAPEQRTRPIYILYNDTLVESPVFQEFVTKRLKRVEEGVRALNIPASVVMTTPPMSETYWVNLLGKGYPAPNRTFRWCMDRLKIQPSARFIKEKIQESSSALLLLGVRKSESVARSISIEKHSAKANYERIIPNDEIQGCWIFRPVMDLTTEQVWDYVRNTTPPWGSNNLSLLELYNDAGMCNATQTCALMDEEAVAESKTILARFGCWTCTVVKRDKSLESLVENGYPELEPLIRFRERIREFSDTPEYRSKTRRSGQPGLGPLTMEARKTLLADLITIQEKIGKTLISQHEIRLIQEQWNQDLNNDQLRAIRKRISEPIT